MSRCIAKVCILVSLLWVGTSHAADQVVTIYFSGTLMTGEMYDPEVSLFGRAETVAMLHYLQKTGEDETRFDHHHKGQVDGPWITFVDWPAKSHEALQILNGVPDDLCEGECVTVNLVGFSRGAVLTMYFANQLLTSDDAEYEAVRPRIKKINILAFDPVPGDGLNLELQARNFNLPGKTSYVGFYSADERSQLFAPVIPNPAPEPVPAPAAESYPAMSHFTVPGSHETMVGNTLTHGHRGPGTYDDLNLGHIPKSLRFISTELMGSSDWGHVRFRSEEGLELAWYDENTDIEDLEDWFGEMVQGMYRYPLPEVHYDYMRKFSFTSAYLFPFTWYSYEAWFEDLIGGISSCLPLVVIDGPHHEGVPPHVSQPRCIYYHPDGYPESGWLGLSNYFLVDGYPFPSIEKKNEDGSYAAWEMVRLHGSLDFDGDLIDFANDNCPVDNNPDQSNADVHIKDDKWGDLCDTCTDTDGDEFGDPGFPANTCATDNCPAQLNPEQADFDKDGSGDACDEDADDDGVLDTVDQCLWTPLGSLVDPLTGCSLAQKVPCEGPLGSGKSWRNHGQYVSTFAGVVREFVAEDLLSRKAAGRAVSEAARSDCGKK